MLRHQRDAAQHDRVRRGPHRLQLYARRDDLKHLAHLRLSEGGADAAPDTAAERQPRVGLDAVVEEPLRTEAPGLWIEIGPPVDERYRGIDLDPGRQRPAADLAWLRQRALGGVDDGAQPQRLLADCLEEGIVPVVDRLAKAREYIRVAQQQLDREGQTGGRGLVPCGEHRE